MRYVTLTTLTILSCAAISTPASAIPTCGKGEMAYAKASWYGKAFHMKNDMAFGGKFNMYNPHIVAHKSLRKNTKVRFKNPRNGRVLEAVVRDRGPYIHGRSFDLSMAGATRLDFKNAGVATLQVCIVK